MIRARSGSLPGGLDRPEGPSSATLPKMANFSASSFRRFGVHLGSSPDVPCFSAALLEGPQAPEQHQDRDDGNNLVSQAVGMRRGRGVGGWHEKRSGGGWVGGGQHRGSSFLCRGLFLGSRQSYEIDGEPVPLFL